MSDSQAQNVSSRRRIRTSGAPAAIGPYSQAVLVDNTLYCSGQIGLDPETTHLVSESVEAETEQILKNLGAILKAASMDFQSVVKCTVFMTDMNDYGVVNEVYARHFSENPPAREAVQVAALPRGARVEISCIAIKA